MENSVLTPASTSLTNLTFVITGTLPNLSRKEVEELIKINGGKVTNSVTSNTSYLVIGESAGSKLIKAQELGTPLLTESDFLNLMQSTS